MTPGWTEEEVYELNYDRLQDDIRDEIDSKPNKCRCYSSAYGLCHFCFDRLEPNEDE